MEITAMTSYGSKKHEEILKNAVDTLKNEGYNVIVLRGRIPDAIAYKGEILLVEAVTKGNREKKAADFRKFYPNINVRIFCGEEANVKTPKERGYRQIVISTWVYDKLMELKGEKSFNQFVSELIDIYKESNVDIAKASTPTVPRVEVKPSIEYRSHLCRDCSLDAKAVEGCRIRQYQYAIHGLKCPRQT